MFFSPLFSLFELQYCGVYVNLLEAYINWFFLSFTKISFRICTFDSSTSLALCLHKSSLMWVSGSVKPLSDSSEEEWNSIFKINLTGTWLVSKYVCSRMRDAKKGGSVINISSIGGLNRGHLPGSLAYSSSKAAVNLLTKVSSCSICPWCNIGLWTWFTGRIQLL